MQGGLLALVQLDSGRSPSLVQVEQLLLDTDVVRDRLSPVWMYGQCVGQDKLAMRVVLLIGGDTAAKLILDSVLLCIHVSLWVTR